MTVSMSTSFYVEQLRDVTVVCFTCRTITEVNFDVISEELLEFADLVTLDRPVQVIAELLAIREVDAIAHVVRCFENDDIVHVSGKINPLADIDVINTELALADLESVEKAFARAEKAAKAQDKDAIKLRDVLGRLPAMTNQDDLAPLFPMSLILQEVSTEREVEIPEEVRQIYAQWRPSPLFRARRLEQALDTPARIYYKYEGGSPAGSHKPNTAIPQAYYNKLEGTKRLSTETGAGQWGAAPHTASEPDSDEWDPLGLLGQEEQSMPEAAPEGDMSPQGAIFASEAEPENFTPDPPPEFVQVVEEAMITQPESRTEEIYWKACTQLVGFLVSFDYESTGSYLELRTGRLLVTSQPDQSSNCLVLAHETVSPSHAVMRVATGGSVQVLDQLSESGTRIRKLETGEEVLLSGEKAALSHGDVVSFGDRNFHVCLILGISAQA